MNEAVAKNEISSSQWQDVWDQFKTHRGALIGSIVFVIIVFGVLSVLSYGLLMLHILIFVLETQVRVLHIP